MFGVLEEVVSDCKEEGDSDYIQEEETYYDNSSIDESDIYFAGAQFLDQAIADSYRNISVIHIR